MISKGYIFRERPADLDKMLESLGLKKVRERVWESEGVTVSEYFIEVNNEKSYSLRLSSTGVFQEQRDLAEKFKKEIESRYKSGIN